MENGGFLTESIYIFYYIKYILEFDFVNDGFD